MIAGAFIAMSARIPSTAGDSSPLRLLLRLISSLVSLIGITFLAFSFLPLLEPWLRFLSEPWSEGSRPTLVVLAGDATTDRILGLHSYWRSVYTAWEWQHGGYQRIIITGSKGLPEAMRDFIVSQGVPPSSVVLETRSTSTRESAVHVAPMLAGDPQPAVLLTSDNHAHRSRLAFEKCGARIIARPIPDAAKRMSHWTGRWPVFLELLDETIKFAGYKFRGWV